MGLSFLTSIARIAGEESDRLSDFSRYEIEYYFARVA